MCAALADENGFVMAYDQAYNLIHETYPHFIKITRDCRFSDWQAAKKAYHGQKGFGIVLTLINMKTFRSIRGRYSCRKI